MVALARPSIIIERVSVCVRIYVTPELIVETRDRILRWGRADGSKRHHALSLGGRVVFCLAFEA